MERRTSCRSCLAEGLAPFLSLGKVPLVDALVPADLPLEDEPTFPLEVAFCQRCGLVQLLHDVPPEQLFVDNYLYFSSYSDDLLEHSRKHAEQLISERGLGPDSLVVEIASNDGYLLRRFADAGVPVLGIDPAPEQAAAAEAAGVPTLQEFFGRDVARRLVAEGKRADVIIANNVLAHVPDVNDFVGGVRALLADDGLFTFENPSVRELIDRCAFDTIYHEHHSYLSCTSVDHLLQRHDLHLNDVAYFGDLHGGTLRWYAETAANPRPAVTEHLEAERDSGVDRLDYYLGFGERVEILAADLRELLRGLKDGGATIAAYGAAAKGAVLLNYVGIDTQLVDFVVDRNPHKQGLSMPGVRVPITSPDALVERRPDYVLLLAWNFANEIVRQQGDYLAAGGRFIVPVPAPRILEG